MSSWLHRSATQPNVTHGATRIPVSSVATTIEKTMIRWLADLVDFPAESQGVFLSGGSMANMCGIASAGSVVMDMHKWFYQSLAGSLLLYRDPDWARQLFSESSDYLRMNEDDSPEQFSFFSISPELSRRFRALPFYISMRHYGLDRMGRNALHNVRCAEYLAERIGAEADLELIAPPQLSILCFRYRPSGLDHDSVDRLNTLIRDRVQLEGDYLISPTRVNERPALRVCIINHATRVEHVEGLLESVLRIGRDLVAQDME